MLLTTTSMNARAGWIDHDGSRRRWTRRSAKDISEVEVPRGVPSPHLSPPSAGRGIPLGRYQLHPPSTRRLALSSIPLPRQWERYEGMYAPDGSMLLNPRPHWFEHVTHAPPTSDRHRHRRSIWTHHQHKSLLRFITCGSVDDGKSTTLIGRLLYDSNLIFEDQLAALEADSKRIPARQGGEIDFAPLESRRPRRRARAGHHHRRRLPVLLDRQAQSSSSPTTPLATNNGIPATWSPSASTA